MNTPLVLIILDGFGVTETPGGNPFFTAKMPFWKTLVSQYPYTTLSASGESVGLPKEQDGNSEAGHLNIGAGRVVLSDSLRISKCINDGSFFENPQLINAVKHAKVQRSRFHIMGLVSGKQSAHAQIEHLLALITFARRHKLPKIFLHLFTDGRDAPPISALGYLEELAKFLTDKEEINSIAGRFYAMDRKREWQRTEMVYNLLTLGHGLASNSAFNAISKAYLRGETDEFIVPTVILNEKGRISARIKNNDSVIFYNLRSDRARQLTKPFVERGFEMTGGFKRKTVLKNLFFVTMTDFGLHLNNIHYAFPHERVVEPLPLALSQFRQMYIAESEKFAHVTYFINGGYADPLAGEERIMVPSPDKANYEKTPKMGLPQIVKIICRSIKAKKYDFIAANFSNPDMIGHTGNIQAAVEALEYVDTSIKKIVNATLAQNGTIVITSDHGNIEEMIDFSTGNVDTKHSSNPVPFVIVNDTLKNIKLRKGTLADVAPTIMKIMNIPKSPGMSGKNLY